MRQDKSKPLHVGQRRYREGLASRVWIRRTYRRFVVILKSSTCSILNLVWFLNPNNSNLQTLQRSGSRGPTGSRLREVRPDVVRQRFWVFALTDWLQVLRLNGQEVKEQVPGTHTRKNLKILIMCLSQKHAHSPTDTRTHTQTETHSEKLPCSLREFYL